MSAPCQEPRSATQSDPCISSVTTAIMITTSNSPVNWSGIHNQGNTKWNLSAKIEHRRPVAIAVLVTSSQSLASHANDYRERSATPARQRQRNGPLLFAAKDRALYLLRWRRGIWRICLHRFVCLQPRTPGWKRSDSAGYDRSLEPSFANR